MAPHIRLGHLNTVRHTSPFDLEKTMTPPVPSVSAITTTTAPVSQTKESEATAKDRLDFLWKIHGYTNDYIRFADSKAGVVSAIIIALIGGVIASRSFDSLAQVSLEHWPIRVWWGAVALVVLLLSFACTILAIRPRLHSTVPKGFIFWTSVIEHGSDLNYAEECRKLTAHEMELNVSRHIFALAVICKRKYFWTNLAIIMGVVGGLMAGSLILVIHALQR
jgi:uncharacterized membrane protein YeaQ/YmgE (transglycosylase-associated protein family)